MLNKEENVRSILLLLMLMLVTGGGGGTPFSEIASNAISVLCNKSRSLPKWVIGSLVTCWVNLGALAWSQQHWNTVLLTKAHNTGTALKPIVGVTNWLLSIRYYLYQNCCFNWLQQYRLQISFCRCIITSEQNKVSFTSVAIT